MIPILLWIVSQAAAIQAPAARPKPIPNGLIYRVPKNERPVNISDDPSGKSCSPKEDK